MNIDKITSNKTIAQFRFGKYSLSIDFNEGLCLMLSDSLILLYRENVITNWHYVEKSNRLEELINLIELPIINVSFIEKTGLIIEFDQYKLIVPKPNGEYEYLHIMSEDEGIYIY